VTRSDKLKETLADYLRAGYPAVWVVCAEEDRVEATVRAVVEDWRERNLTLWQWTCTDGLVQVDGTTVISMMDPYGALCAIDSEAEKASGVFVVKDLHPFLQSPNVVRKVKDLCVRFKAGASRIVFTSPVSALPAELDKLVATIEFSLPDAGEIDATLGKLAESLHLGEIPDRERVVEAALGLTEREAEDAFALSLVQTKRVGGTARFDARVIAAQKAAAVNKGGMLEVYDPTYTLDDVGGLGELKNWFTLRAKAFSSEAREFGLPSPRGCLLLGVSGSGKSLCAKALGTLWNKPVLRLDMGKMFGSLVGQSEATMRRALDIAESTSPCILFMDEVEKGLSGSKSSGQTDGGTTSRVMGTFLTWMQDHTAPVFVIGTCNDVQSLPPEWLRKGRFDEVFFVDLPTEQERMDILRIHVTKRSRKQSDKDLKTLAGMTPGFSGAELEEVVISGLYTAFDANRDLTTKDLQAAIASTIPLSRTMETQVNALREWAHGRARPATKQEPHSAKGRAVDLGATNLAANVYLN